MKKIVSMLLVLSMIAVYLPSLGGLTVLAEEVTEALTEEVTKAEKSPEWKYESFTYDNNTEDTSDDITGIEVTEYLGTQTDIYVPANIDGLPVLKLGDGLFKDNTAINSVTLSNNIRVIGKEAFSGCSNLVCIVTNEGLAEIEENAFLNCVNYNSVILYEAVTVVADTAFEGCEILTIYCVENSVAYNYAVEKGIAWVLLGSETEPEEYTENGITYYIQNGEAVAISCDDKTIEEVTIPSTVKGYPVTELRGTFEGCTELMSVTIPNSITRIGNNAFKNCYSLASVIIPETVTSIGDSAFYFCRTLTSIAIPDCVTTIGRSAFYYCGALTDVMLPSGVTYLDDYAFTGCTSLTNIIIPNSVTSIGAYTFGSTGLTSINIPDSVTSLGDYAFRNADLTSVFIPDTITSMGTYVFSDCESLTSVTISSGVTRIENYTFYGCSRLTNVVIPETVTSIGKYAFYGCTSLLDINIPNSVTSIGESAFYNCANLWKLIIPSSVTSIGGENILPDNAIWIVEENSYAHTYSVAKDILYFIATDNEEPKLITDGGITYCLLNSEAVAIKADSTLTDVEIPSVINGFPVTMLRRTFYNCTSLTSVMIPDCVTSIGAYTFYNCAALTDVTLPEGLTKIQNNAFQGCSSLTSISIPQGVTTIKDYTFEECTALTSVKFSENLKSIGAYAFQNCKSLAGVIMPNGMESIGNYAFNGCASLKNIEIPRGIETVGYGLFRDCINLTDVVVADGVVNIAEYAFYGCVNLLKIKLPSSIKSIYTSSVPVNTVLIVQENSYAYQFAVNKGYLYFVPEDGEDAEIVIENGITYCIVNNEAIAINADNTLIQAIIPSAVNGSPVTELRASFKNCAELTSVAIPDSVKIIGDYAFYNCTSLTSVIIPNGVVCIGKYAFTGCSSLESAIIPDSVTKIGNWAFKDCVKLESIIIPEGVTSIGQETFRNCRNLTSVDIPDSVTNIGMWAFKDCSSLKKVVIPIGVNSIGEEAFSGCTGMTSLSIIGHITSMGQYVFKSCTSLTDLTISDGIKLIGDYAFVQCTNMTSVVLPDSVTSIGREAFYGCTNLTNITIPNSVTSIGNNAFKYCRNLNSIAIPGSVTDIGAWAFDGCTNLTSVVISEGVVNIKSGAFYGCESLTNVTVPDSVTSIGSKAFYDCESLSRVKVSGNVTTLYTDSFPNTTILLVEENSYAHTFAVENDRLYFVVGKVVNPEIAYGAGITGTVTDNDGNAISGATIEILYDDGEVKESVVTDESGNYSFTYAEVGRYTISATDASGNTTHETVSVKRMNVFDVYLAGETDLVITSSWAVTGTVTGGSEGTATITNEDGVVIATTEITGGVFAFENIPNGEYVVKVETESGTAIGEVTIFGADAEIELTVVGSSSNVTGRVEDEYGNERIWATVTFYNSDGVAVARTKTDKYGRYTVTGLEVDEYAIVAESGDIRNDKNHGHKRSYELKGYGYIDITAVGEFEADVIIVYDENDHESSISGKVTAQGSGQESEVVLHDVFRNEVAKCETGNNGKYKFVNIKDGLYFITARTEANGMGMTVVSVRHGKVYGKTDIYVARPDKIREHEDRMHEIPNCSNRDDARKYKDKIVEEKRFYDSLSKKEKKHCSREYVDRLHKLIEWINNVEYDVKGDEPDAKISRGGSMVDCDEIDNEKPVRIEIEIEKRDRCDIGEDGVRTDEEFIQQSIEDSARDGELGQYYNISMRKGDGEKYRDVDNIHKDTNTTGKVRITMPIPEEHRGHKNYYFVHVHNGEAVTLVDLDDDPDTITFETDRFSTFALMWHDKPFFEDMSKDVVKIGDAEYSSLQEAIDAAEDGDVITLGENVAPKNAAVVGGKNITVDVAGFSLTGDITLKANANLIVNDSSEAKTGKIDGSIVVDIEENEKLTSILTVYDGICENIQCSNLATIGTGDGFKVYRGEETGASMTEGAQVRIGEGVGADGKIAVGSGLRFVTTVNRNDSLVAEALEHYSAETKTYDKGYEVGVKITAEGSNATVYIPATLWQSEGDVFTSALTNIAEGNYNRKFTATAYVTVEGVCYEAKTSTVRSIYQVAAGLLTETYAESEIESEKLLKVLNAYVNQTGIRLVMDGIRGFYDIHDENSVLEKAGKYSGGAFFEIENAKVDGDVYTVTIKPIGINTYINTESFAEYIRINNNNAQIRDYVKLTDNGDNTYTLEFDYGAMTE